MDAILEDYFPGDDLAPLPPRADVSVGVPLAGNNPMRALPPEVRYLVLLEAFGNRTIHLLMDPARERGISLYLGRWEQSGVVCMNRARQLWRESAAGPGGKRPACEAGGAFCGTEGMGVMGWLLSCRDAYLEAVDVLYGSNTLHFWRAQTFVVFPRLFAPGRLASVRDLDVMLDMGAVTSWGCHLERADRALATISVLIGALPATFPGLRCLALDAEGLDEFLWKRRPDDDRVRAVEELLLLIDAAVASLGCLEECMVALPWSAWVPWKMVATGEPPRRVTLPGDPGFLENDRIPDAVWRDIPVRDGRLGSGAGGLKGYWVRHEELGCDSSTLTPEYAMQLLDRSV